MQFEFFNDNSNGDSGFPGSNLISFQPFVLKIADSVETVEDNGVGGIIKTGDMAIEVNDVSNLFRDTIFNKTYTTKCYARVTWAPNGTSNYYSVIYGKVDYSTVEYPSYFDNEAGTEYHSCKFNILGLLADLEGVSMFQLVYDSYANNTYLYPAAIKAANSASIISAYAGIGGSYVWFLNLVTLLKTMLQYANIPCDAVSIVSDDTFNSSGIGGTGGQLADTYFMYGTSSGSTIGVRALGANEVLFFLADNVGSGDGFVGVGDLRSVMNMIASHFLCYPYMIYDAMANTHTLVFKKRGQGNLVNLLTGVTTYPDTSTATTSTIAELKSSSLQTFFGYDAIQVSQYNDSTDMPAFYPPQMTSSIFNVRTRTFNFTSYFAFTAQKNTTPFGSVLYEKDGSNNFAPIDSVVSRSQTYTSVQGYLRDNFVRYWANIGATLQIHNNPKQAKLLYPNAYQRTYHGVGLGNYSDVPTLGILDSSVINGANYSVVEIRRRFIQNEMDVKAVQY